MDHIASLLVWVSKGVKAIGAVFNWVSDQSQVGKYHVARGKLKNLVLLRPECCGKYNLLSLVYSFGV